MEKLFIIGEIVNTQGVKGDVRVLPATFDVKRFELLDSIDVYSKNKKQTYAIEKVRYHKNLVILKLAGVDTMTEAQALKNSLIKIPQSKLLPLEDDEYYLDDLIDTEVFDTEDNYLGALSDVIFTGANDVYVVKNDKKEILIPAIKDCIKNVDIQNKKMIVKLMEGMV